MNGPVYRKAISDLSFPTVTSQLGLSTPTTTSLHLHPNDYSYIGTQKGKQVPCPPSIAIHVTQTPLLTVQLILSVHSMFYKFYASSHGFKPTILLLKL